MTDRLYRSRHDRMLAGVAGGLAEMWDVDPSLVRIVWALLVVFTGGIALVVYIVMAIVVPDEDDAPTTSAQWPAPPASSPPTEGGPAPETTGGPAAAGVTAAAAAAPTGPGASPAPTAPGPWASGFSAREQARDARRQARQARRAARGHSAVNGSAIFGVILVAIGIYFLGREWLPQLDFDWFWPLILVGIGVLLLVSALARRPDDPGGAS